VSELLAGGPPAEPAQRAASTAPGQWFARDAERHLLDRPRFCPMCGASLDRGLTSESWAADERIFLTWCAACEWTGNIVRFGRATGFEPEH
jgi:hypothetical protein